MLALATGCWGGGGGGGGAEVVQMVAPVFIKRVGNQPNVSNQNHGIMQPLCSGLYELKRNIKKLLSGKTTVNSKKSLIRSS